MGSKPLIEKPEKPDIHTKGYMYDSLVYRFKDYQSRCYDLEVRDFMYEKNVSREEARKTVRHRHERDLMRFIEILNDAIGDHS